ncbi:uncharacterized protein [Chelonus insularis]|uniref:uncharacterized protein n=1 Tax=Chelonus insularis TaxID=460826 RepID=UPI00158C5D12|nr:uncharacterized protein LOC118064777 [Chelonus insularis]
MHSTKCRRNILKQERGNLRKKKENTESLQYFSNCGLDIDANNNEDIQNDEEIADSLQLAVKIEGRTFSQYIEPTQAIAAAVSAVNGLKAMGNELYLNDCNVSRISLKEASQKFKEFLLMSTKPSVLVAHNEKFDAKHLIRAIMQSGMVDDFQKITE